MRIDINTSPSRVVYVDSRGSNIGASGTLNGTYWFEFSDGHTVFIKDLDWSDTNLLQGFNIDTQDYRFTIVYEDDAYKFKATKISDGTDYEYSGAIESFDFTEARNTYRAQMVSSLKDLLDAMTADEVINVTASIVDTYSLHLTGTPSITLSRFKSIEPNLFICSNGQVNSMKPFDSVNDHDDTIGALGFINNLPDYIPTENQLWGEANNGDSLDLHFGENYSCAKSVIKLGVGVFDGIEIIEDNFANNYDKEISLCILGESMQTTSIESIKYELSVTGAVGRHLSIKDLTTGTLDIACVSDYDEIVLDNVYVGNSESAASNITFNSIYSILRTRGTIHTRDSSWQDVRIEFNGDSFCVFTGGDEASNEGVNWYSYNGTRFVWNGWGDAVGGKTTISINTMLAYFNTSQA